MKALKLYFQFIAHWIYILMSLENYYSTLPIYNFISTYGMIILVHLIAVRFFPKKISVHFKLLNLFLICNSVYLNVAYDYNYFYLLHIVVLISLFGHAYFRTKKTNSPIFNASIFGLFVSSMLFTGSVSYPPFLWSSHVWQLCVVFIVGILVTGTAKTIAISFSYILTTIIIAFIKLGAMSLFPTNIFLSTLQSYAVLTSLLSVGKLIFVFHVISEPASAPRTPKAQIAYGASIAAFEICLRFSGAYYSVLISYLLIQVLYKIFSDRDLNIFKTTYKESAQSL